MAESKHTPGPWLIDFNPAQSPNIWIEADTNAGIAKVEICEHRPGRPEELNAEDWANARLIAAAPEMRDRLRALWIAVKAYDMIGLEGTVLIEEMSEVRMLLAHIDGEEADRG